MKLTRIFGVVLALHFAVVGTLLVQPGCQSTTASGTRGSRPAPEATATGTGVDSAFNAGVAGGTLQPPTRPSGGDVSSGMYTGGEMLEPLASAPAAKPGSYTVVKGDTLGKIANAHGVTLNALLGANNLNRDSIIRPGQDLVIPVPAEGTTVPRPEQVDGLRYEVKRGDALSKIARNYRVSVADIKAANNLTGDTIQVGQVLVIPGAGSMPATPTQAAVPAAAGDTYTVQRGDALSTIARRFGVSLNELMALNNISDPTRLQAGQQLQIPAGARAPAAPARTIGEKEAAVVREENRINSIPGSSQPRTTSAPAPSAAPAPVPITPNTGSTVTPPPPPASAYDPLDALGDEPETPTLEIEE